MSHDPSRRLFLSGLPPEVTRKDIVEFVKKRTRANPMYVEIGKDKAGKCKGFAHATVEGLRSVVEALDGVPLNGNPVHAAAAKPHYSVPLMAVKKAREDEEQRLADERMEARMAARELEKERAAKLKALVKSVMEADSDAEDADDAAGEEGSEVTNAYRGVKCHRAESGMPGADEFSGSKMKYAQIATEIADAQRLKHKSKGSMDQAGHKAGYAHQQYGGPSGGYGGQQQQQQQQFGGGGGGYGGGYGAPAGGAQGGYGMPQPRHVNFQEAAAKPAPPPEPAAPPPPPQPNKEAKKLANLQAKLAALKQKLGK